MLVTTEEAKKYLNDINNTISDPDIEVLIIAAEEYLKNAGCKMPENNELAKLAVKILVIHWHENREIIGKSEKIPLSLPGIILQLQYCYEQEGEPQ